MITDRSFTTISLAIATILAIGIFRPSGEHINTGLDPDEFWIRKAFTEKKFDLILAGDSRVYRGLSPEVIKESLPLVETINYGFSGNGYNKPYLDAINERVKSNGKISAIILGITPMSLTEQSAKANDFLQLKEKGEAERLIGLYFSKLTLPFKPFELYRYYLLLTNDSRLVRYFQHYHEDGWVSGYKLPENPREQLVPYERQFTNNPVSNRVIDLINFYTKDWTKTGKRVFAFRVPTTDEMVTLEDEFSRFDETVFKTSFTEAGGIWLEFDQGGYHSYDGSHLHENAAVNLSKDLATKLVENGITFSQERQ